ncbi:Ribosomal RNA large subunit methyltransferase E [Diplonema papillatum]|nr:Ribosomal RNA large subunit methyltransferase E [Diplonema papillatum]
MQNVARTQKRHCQRWMEKRVNEKWTKKARDEGYRARSAYKLMQLDEKFHLFNGSVRCVVDLGSAPGSWLQVASVKMGMHDQEQKQVASAKRKHLIGIDLLPMPPVTGVQIIRGDFTSRDVQEQLLLKVRDAAEEMKIPILTKEASVDVRMKVFAAENTSLQTGDLSVYHYGRQSQVVKNYNTLRKHVESLNELPMAAVDGVMSDMAAHDAHVPNAGKSGEIESQIMLAESAKHFALKVLKEGGWFVTKVFNGEGATNLYKSLSLYFERTAITRPPAVQEGSRESFVVASGFIGRERLLNHSYNGMEERAPELDSANPRKMRQVVGKRETMALPNPFRRRAPSLSSAKLRSAMAPPLLRGKPVDESTRLSIDVPGTR